MNLEELVKKNYDKLNENDFTIGSCSYTEYPRKESNNKGELMYYPLFAQ